MCFVAGLVAAAVRRRGRHAHVRARQGQCQPPRLPHQQEVLRKIANRQLYDVPLTLPRSRPEQTLRASLAFAIAAAV